MPCALCKENDHSLLGCRDDSIQDNADEITMMCTRIISYPNGTFDSLNELEDYVKGLSCTMLKAILYNTPEFNANGETLFNGSGKKVTLVGKVIYLFLSNMRRKHVTRFSSQSPYIRKIIFKRQIFWHKIANGFSEYVANQSATRSADGIEQSYSQWITALKLDVNNLIVSAIDNSFMQMFAYGTEYDLNERGEEELYLHQFHRQYNINVLREINYCESESLYIKKRIIDRIISRDYSVLIQYIFIANGRLRLFVRSEENVVQHQQQQQSNLKTLNIAIVLEKETSDCVNFDCAICLDPKSDKEGRMVLSCNHEFCGTCMNHYLTDYRSKTSQPACALCRGVIHKITVKNLDLVEDKEIVENLQNSCVF